jgi:hypothetical protein
MQSSVRLDRLGKLALALAALALGVLVGLIAVAPMQGSVGAPLASLYGLLLPAAGALVLVVVSLYSPLAALLLWLVLAPYSKHIPLDLSLGAGIPDMSLTRLMAGFMTLLILVQAALGRRKLRRLTWADLAYGVFLAALFISVPRSEYDTLFAVQNIVDAYLVPFVALFVARQIVRDVRDLRWFTVALLVTGVGFALLVIREQLTGEVLLYARQALNYSPSFRKVVSLMGNAAPMGLATALTLPLGLVLAGQTLFDPAPDARKRIAQVLLIIAVGIVALGAYMTYNRASWLAVAIPVILLTVMRPRMRRLLLPLLGGLAVLALVFWPVITQSAAVSERLLEGESIDYRTTALTLGLQMVRQDPLFGLGYYNFGPIAKDVYGWDPFRMFGIYPPAHNSYTFFLVSGGLLALIPYLAWMLLLAWGAIKRYAVLGTHPVSARREQARDALAAGLAMLLSYAVASATFDNGDHFLVNVLFYMALGAIWGATEKDV